MRKGKISEEEERAAWMAIAEESLKKYGIIPRMMKCGTSTLKPKGESLKPKKAKTDEEKLEEEELRNFFRITSAESNKDIWDNPKDEEAAKWYEEQIKKGAYDHLNKKTKSKKND
jgi:hypothetical protein